MHHTKRLFFPSWTHACLFYKSSEKIINCSLCSLCRLRSYSTSSWLRGVTTRGPPCSCCKLHFYRLSSRVLDGSGHTRGLKSLTRGGNRTYHGTIRMMCYSSPSSYQSSEVICSQYLYLCVRFQDRYFNFNLCFISRCKIPRSVISLKRLRCSVI